MSRTARLFTIVFLYLAPILVAGIGLVGRPEPLWALSVAAMVGLPVLGGMTFRKGSLPVRTLPKVALAFVALLAVLLSLVAALNDFPVGAAIHIQITHAVLLLAAPLVASTYLSLMIPTDSLIDDIKITK